MMNKAEKKFQSFDFIREKFKTHVDAHTGIEIVSPYICIEEFAEHLTDFAEKEYERGFEAGKKYYEVPKATTATKSNEKFKDENTTK